MDPSAILALSGISQLCGRCPGPRLVAANFVQAKSAMTALASFVSSISEVVG